MATDRYDEVVNPAFWRHENVQYLYTNARRSISPGIVKLAGPAKTRAPVDGLPLPPARRQSAGVGRARVVKAGDEARSAPCSTRASIRCASPSSTRSHRAVARIKALPAPADRDAHGDALRARATST